MNDFTYIFCDAVSGMTQYSSDKTICAKLEQIIELGDSDSTLTRVSTNGAEVKTATGWVPLDGITENEVDDILNQIKEDNGISDED